MSRDECSRYYRGVAALIAGMRESWQLGDVYCAALALSGSDRAQAPAEAMRELWARIDRADMVVLLWPEPAATSALVEVGYALARGIPVVCFHQEKAALPFLLAEDSECVRRFAYQAHTDLERMVATSKIEEILPRAV